MRGAINPLPQYVLMAWFLFKLRGNFTFTFTISTTNIKKEHCRTNFRNRINAIRSSVLSQNVVFRDMLKSM